jgi:hypothetical protein
MQDSVAFFCACAAARESETLKRSSERGPPAAIWPFVQKKEEKPQKRNCFFCPVLGIKYIKPPPLLG